MIKKEEFIEIFEKKILDAMDESAVQELDGGKGWLDGELPSFLPAIRKQAERAYNRSGK